MELECGLLPERQRDDPSGLVQPLEQSLIVGVPLNRISAFAIPIRAARVATHRLISDATQWHDRRHELDVAPGKGWGWTVYLDYL